MVNFWPLKLFYFEIIDLSFKVTYFLDILSDLGLTAYLGLTAVESSHCEHKIRAFTFGVTFESEGKAK